MSVLERCLSYRESNKGSKEKQRTNPKFPFYRGVRLIEVSVKRESTVYLYLFIYQLFWTQASPEGMCTNGTQVPCEMPSLPNPTTREGWPHHRGLRPLLFSNSDVGSFTSKKNKSVKVLWDGTYGFSSLSEKTRKSNHLQMSLQRQQHFLLNYLKSLSVGPAGLWTRDLPLSRPALSQLS